MMAASRGTHPAPSSKWRHTARAGHGHCAAAALLASLLAIAAACGTDKKPVPPEASTTTVPTIADAQGSLEKARAAVEEVTSVRVALNIEISPSGKTPVQVAADLTYVAPTSVFGSISAPNAKLDIIGDAGGVYARRGDHWLKQSSFIPINGLRDYGGGLVNLRELGANLSNVTADHETAHIEKVHGTLPSLGLSAYLVRLVESVTLQGVPSYFAKSADIWLDDDSGLPTHIEVDGMTQPTKDGGTFRIVMDFSSYGTAFVVPSTPVAVTPIGRPGLAALTPTPGKPEGCANGGSASAASNDIGRIYRHGENLRVAMNFVGPGCKHASAEFIGQFVAGSPRYEQVCRKQCGSSISAVFTSGQVELPGSSGVVEIGAPFRPFPATPSIDESDSIEGFRLCQIDVTFNDGALGGTFYRTTVGDPGFDAASGSAC